jgi:hypothetical protein
MLSDTAFSAQRWAEFWRNFKGEPQQLAGIEELRLAIAESNPVLMDEGAGWVAKFHEAPPAPAAPAPGAGKVCIAGVPYYDGQGWRDCFSATCAMIAAWAGKVSGENEYNHIRQRHGDSTVAGSQIGALSDLGLTAHYATNGSKAKLISLLDQGKPVGTGILHHGQASSPSGGGHWMLIVGHDADGVIALDPYGELNVSNGTWAQQGSGGDHVHYSWKNWLPRWEVAGGDGYYIYVDR